MKNEKIILIIVIILIVALIWYFGRGKIMPVGEIEKKELFTDNSSANMAKEKIYPRAKELVSPQGYFNIDNITIAQHLGKDVILVDFWTYTCINCQRTLPYLNAWYEKYKDKGLVIIGVHTPEFEFEKNYDNVKKAIEKYGIKYPVVQDNDYATWRAYKNQYWPRKYLIDIDGFIVYDHIGEGSYEETEKEIQKALQEREDRLKTKGSISNDLANPNITAPDFQYIRTPEIYFGYQFSRDQNGNSEGWKEDKVVSYKIPSSIDKNKFYLSGDWMNNKDNMESKSDGEIKLLYSAKKVNLVAGADSLINISVYLDNRFVNNVSISNYDLYTIYSSESYDEHTLEIKTPKGLKAFTFTFG